MKLIVIAALALVAAAAAAPAEEPPKILRSEFEQEPEGGYKFGFETENGINRNENGEVKTVNDEDNKPQQVVVMRGTYSYTDPEGKQHSFNYYADETGYHVEGEDVPKSQ